MNKLTKSSLTNEIKLGNIPFVPLWMKLKLKIFELGKDVRGFRGAEREIRFLCFEKVKNEGLKTVWADFASLSLRLRVAKKRFPRIQNCKIDSRVAKHTTSRRQVQKFYLMLAWTDFASPN